MDNLPEPPDNLPEPTDNLPEPTDNLSHYIQKKHGNFDQIQQFWPNITIITKPYTFDQIS